MNEDFYDHVRSKNPLVSYMLGSYFGTLERRLSALSVSNSVDVGCGKGYVTQYVHLLMGHMPLGIDCDDEKLVLAKKTYPHLRFEKGNGTRLHLEDNSFDLVIATEVLEHQDLPDNMLRELGRVSRNYAFLSVPNDPIWRIANILRGKYLNDLGNPPGHIQHWSRKSFERLLLDHFSEVDVESVMVWNIALCKK